MYKAFANTSLFTITYLIAVVPNLFFSNIVEKGLMLTTFGIASMLYFLSMIVILAICHIRGSLIGKHWLVLIPTVAFVFDMTPSLTGIHIVPHVYHALAIIIGMACPLGADTHSNTKVV